jgi:hypothetical protein
MSAEPNDSLAAPGSEREQPLRRQSVAIAAALEAGDGVALKMIVDRWAAVSGEERARFLKPHSPSVKARWASRVSLSLVFGTTVVLFATAMIGSARYSARLAIVGLVGALALTAAGCG